MHIKDIGKKILKGSAKQKALIAIILLFVIMLFANQRFYNAYNLINMLKSNSILAIIGYGVTFVIICGGVDLSVGGVMALSGIITIQLMPIFPLWLCILCGLVSGVVVGVINGFIIVKQKTEAFVVSLGMGFLLLGIAQQLTNAHPISASNMDLVNFGESDVAGIPVLVIAMFVMLIISHIILRYTQFGRNCYAIGGDYDVAVYSGINAVRTKWLTFIISGFMAAIGGILLVARLNTGSATYGETTALTVCAGIVVGGTSFSGGVGGVIQTTLGMFLFAVLESAMVMIGINIFIQVVLRGIIILSVVAFDCYSRKRIREAV